MDKILIEDLKIGNSFSEDCFILEDLFFLPKNFPIQTYHLKILKDWNINSILTNGLASNTILNKFIESEKKEEDNNKSNGKALLDNTIKGFIEDYKTWIKTSMEFFNSIVYKKELDRIKVKNFIDEIISKVKTNKNNALLLFGKKFENILYVFPQSIEIVILTNIIGDGLNLSPVSLSNLATASLFHDIGMLKVPKEIIEKESSLNQNDISIIRNHTIIGYKLLLDVKYSPIIASGALQHHERLDGKGYPNNLTQNKITDIAKIIAVSDVYCAAISSKPYKKSPIHAKQIIQELLKEGGIAFSSIVLKELIKNISFFPIGSLVVLSDNTIVRVVGTSGVAMKPIVKEVKKDESGEIIDLSKREDLYIKDSYNG